MSAWRATKAKRVYAVLMRLGWTLKKQVGSHQNCNVPAGPTSHSPFTIAKRSARLPSPGLGRIRGFARKIFDLQRSPHISDCAVDSEMRTPRTSGLLWADGLSVQSVAARLGSMATILRVSVF